MIDMFEVVADADLQAPQPFTILRSTGQFVSGGFSSAVASIQAYGPVQRATDKEIQMLPEADRVGAIMNFWWTKAIYVTTGKASLPTTHGETPAGAVPGTVYTLSAAPPGGVVNFYRDGSLLTPGVDYGVSGVTVTLQTPTVSGTVLYATWPVLSPLGTNAADILVYNNEKYRVLAVKHYPGSGYWRAMGTRMSGM